MNDVTLLAGLGEADITPDTPGVELSGQYYQRVSRGIHSRLKTVAMVLLQKEACSVMVSLDNVGAPEDFQMQLERAIRQSFPVLAAAKLIVNATHTHNAPSLSGPMKWWKPDPRAISSDAYGELVERKVLEAVEAALHNLQEAGTAGALDFARFGHCRRAMYADGTAEMYGRTDRDDFIGMEGGEDSGVQMLFFFDQQMKPFGCIVNATCPSQVMEATYLVSSDYMGALREKLKLEFGSHFLTVCQIGAAGDQSPRDLTRYYKWEPDFWHPDGVDVLSERLVGAIRRGYARAARQVDFHPVLQHRILPIKLPRRRVSYAEYIRAKQEIARLESTQNATDAYRDFCAEVHRNETIPGLPGPYDSKLHPFVLIRNTEAVIDRYEQQNTAPELSLDIHIVWLGNIVMACNPFELFVEFGQRIKARSFAEQTFIVQLANGIAGYLPTRRAEDLGGYGGLIINGQIGSDGGDKLADETVASINRRSTSAET